uniref:Acyl-coenzyme A oxidase n=1 Tax=Sciurus vulgaris TaxID=55149 RepID=A0A8D2B5C3_SCIVU
MEPAPELGLGDSSLHRYLDGEFWSLKNELRRLLGGCPLFRHRYGLSLDEMRALTVQRVKSAMDLPPLKHAFQGQVSVLLTFVWRCGGVLSMADIATVMKCGIIYWLFGGAVRNLGSPRYVTKWLQPLQEQKYSGMFAMTEKGHGSNARGIQTQATFDPAGEFTVHTPCGDAQKMFIGNLILAGRSQGIGFLHVCISFPFPLGLHGVDNGILIFNKVRIPRENQLDKFGSVAPDGRYHSPIKNKSAGFNAMLAALTPLRLAVTFQAMSAMKLGLTIAIRYSHSQRQFGPKAKEEVRIIEHQTQMLWLMPHLATILGLIFASRHAGTLLDEAVFQRSWPTAARCRPWWRLKAYSSWESVGCLQGCRESAGGMGYMMENRISDLKCDADVFVTFEGDNVVMLQVVARELLARYTQQHRDKLLSGLLGSWAASVSDKLRISFLAFNTDAIGNLAFLLKAVNFRERVLQRGLVARIYDKAEISRVAFLPLDVCLRPLLSAFSNVLLFVHFLPLSHPQFCLLYGTKLVFRERAWYLEHRYVTPRASRRIRSQLLDLCDSVKDDALRVIAAFNIPHANLHAPIAGIPNPRATWAFYPARILPLAGEGARSQRPKLGAKL